MDIVPLLRRLSEACGISGYERAVQDLVRDELARYADALRTDAVGNLIAHKRGSGPEPRRAVMVACHVDEIGLIVSELERGFIHFQQVGGYDERILPGQEVLVHGRVTLPGIIGIPPLHLLAAGDAEKPLPASRLLIDVGVPVDRLPALVRVGDPVTMRQDLVELKGDLVAGKALDNRVSVAAMIVCLEQLCRLRHEWDLYAVATAQEEMGMKGAVASTYGLQPDLGIAVDVTWARQPGAPDEYTYELGKGPTIGVGPNFHPKLQEALLQAAKSIEIPVHREPAARPPGTDAFAMQISREGIPAALISIPLRNIHTPVETVSIKDVERTGRLLASFVGSLDDAFLLGLAWDLGIEGQV